jgi:hypothetical protein
MSKILGLPVMPFDVMYPEKAMEMKRTVLEYIKVLHRSQIENADGADENNTIGIQKNILQIDKSGYPVAPRPLSGAKVTRGTLESIYRLYITRHYR